jgi:hypothetical protein
MLHRGLGLDYWNPESRVVGCDTLSLLCLCVFGLGLAGWQTGFSVLLLEKVYYRIAVVASAMESDYVVGSYKKQHFPHKSSVCELVSTWARVSTWTEGLELGAGHGLSFGLPPTMSLLTGHCAQSRVARGPLFDNTVT